MFCGLRKPRLAHWGVVAVCVAGAKPRWPAKCMAGVKQAYASEDFDAARTVALVLRIEDLMMPAVSGWNGRRNRSSHGRGVVEASRKDGSRILPAAHVTR
jgi:hypothetical protein